MSMIGRTGSAAKMLPRAATVATATILPNNLTPATLLTKVKPVLKSYLASPALNELRKLPTSALTACAGVTGPCQVRYAHTDVRVPDFNDYRKSLNAEPTLENQAPVPARMYSYLITAGAVAGSVYLGKNVVHDLISSIESSKQDLALAKMEVELDEIPEGQSMMFKWKGKPIFIRNRTQEDIDRERSVNLNELRDPQHDEDRTRDPKWLVVVAICTHLGCVPVMDAGAYGGYYCPCHGSHYDASGRIRKGPAPLNLEVPYHEFPEPGVMLIGKSI